jgi:hypothetical protein
VLVQFDPAIREAVHRASKRSSAVVHEEMKAGIYDLATIACVAPWFGIFGTVVGIVNSFGHCFGQRSTCIGPVALGLSESMWFTALGLMVGLVALWSYEYLAARLRGLDLAMENASLDLLNQLSRFPSRFAIEPMMEPSTRPIFGELPLEDVQREERFFRGCLILAGVALALEWFVQAARFVPGYDSPYLYSSAVLYACFSVPITLAISCVFVYPFWAKFLRRRPGALVAIGSILCLCWSVTELVLGKHLP